MRRFHNFCLRLLAVGLFVVPVVCPAAFGGLEGKAELAWYLPDSHTYDAQIPKPAAVIGHEVGALHVSHDRLVSYFKAIAESSDRVALTSTGRTYEGRELLLVAISSAANIAALDDIRAEHIARVAGKSNTSGPTVVALGYSVHGNEASGSNAAMLVAYHLAAATDAETLAMLNDTIVLIDPSLNPDGLSRFAQWVNSNRGKIAIADRSSREHLEAWPGGRTNHYWFDLNRDWLPAQHPESRARLGWFHSWRPHVLGDFHEMGTDQTFFFQPGVPSRTNPLTPAENVAITNELAKFHAAALDEKNALYYSEESYDDFYYGKGSTYPDIHGAIGLLFEQASARGHIKDSRNGRLGFPFAVRNQYLTSLSTLRGAHALRDRLARNLFEFHAQARAEARKDSRGGFVVANPGDAARMREFMDVLGIHQIEVLQPTRAVEIDGIRYAPEACIFVPLDQPQYRMVRALFDTPTTFLDNTFYDVSAWTLPLSFDLPFKSVSRSQGRTLRGDAVPAAGPELVSQPLDANAFAWVIDWRDFYAGRVVNKALAAGAQARVATRGFSTEGADFAVGSVVIPAGLVAEADKAGVLDVLRSAGDYNVRVRSVKSGLTERGIDLGSPSLETVAAPRVALVVGRGTNAYEAGEVWHLLDQRFEIPVSLIDIGALGRVNLSDYSHLLMVDGNYANVSENAVSKIAAWVRGGGILAGQRRAATWAIASDKFVGASDGKSRQKKGAKDADDAPGPAQRDYAERDEWEAQKVIGGAIFAAELDVSHPLGFGFPTRRIPVFHRGTSWLTPSDNPFENVAIYSEQPLLAGFTSPENIEELAGSVSVRQTRVGRGSLVLFSDIPAFRAYWFGTSRFWLNALFFASAVERVAP